MVRQIAQCLVPSVLFLLTFWADPVIARPITADENIAPGSQEKEVGNGDVSLSFAELAAKARPSLVLVRSTDRTGAEFGQGAGFVIDSSGLICTARHTIGDGRDVTVELPDGTSQPVVEVYASSQHMDLCIIRIDVQGLTPLPISSEDEISQGKEVVALGHPRGDRNVIVNGLVSGHQEIEGIRTIRLSMPIEPGNSGGPVLNLQGSVVGIVTMKSATVPNVGFALPAGFLRDLLTNPNPIPMHRWRTIGSLDQKQWTTLFGANWRQRAGRIKVDGAGSTFGGRTLCLHQQDLPDFPFDVKVLVRLDDERGAAGLVFHADGGDQHYGFYPSAGNLRFTRFNGPDVNSWTVLHNEPHEAYQPEEWNALLVRIHSDHFECFVNGIRVFESRDSLLPSGKVGLAAFRGTVAEFRRFEVGSNLLNNAISNTALTALQQAADAVSAAKPAEASVVAELLPFEPYSDQYLENEARRLEMRATRLRTLASDIHAEKIRRELATAVGLQSSDQPTLPTENLNSKPDLLRAALLLAQMDNSDVDVNAYLERVDQMADEVKAMCRQEAAESERLSKLDTYLFQELAMRGSRFEYENRSNSYLNEVIDDREGLPITLAVLYMEIARRLDLNVVGVGLPGHFVVRFEPQDATLSTQTIDVFDQGRRLSDDDIAEILAESGFPNDPRFREAKSIIQITERMVVNLLTRAERERDDEDVLRYLETLTMLAPDVIEHRAKRLEMRARTGRLAMAIEDANWFLQEKPPAVNVEQVRALRQSLEEQLERQNQAIR